MRPLKISEIKPEGNYIMDEDANLFIDLDHFNNYYFDSITGDGVIKDNYENACEEYQEFKYVVDISGYEILNIIKDNYVE